MRLGRRFVADARAHGAQAIAVVCPLCHTNLDLRQAAMTGRGEEPLPALYITELVGLAVGLSPAELGINRHFVDAAPLLAGLAAQAEADAATAAAAAAAAAKERA